jgi:ABC-type transporter Mla subunit MlaD
MKKEIKVGLTVMAAIVLLYLTIAWVGRSGLFAADQLRYTLIFEQVNGLLEGDPVVVRGYPAGRVVNILPDAEAVQVEIALDPKVKLYGDAFAEIQIKELMGGKQVALWPGQTGSALSEGDRIAGKTSLDFSTAFSRFGGVFEQFSPEQIDRWQHGLDSLGRLMGATFDPGSLQSIMGNLQTMAERLNRQTAQLPVARWTRDTDSALVLATVSLQLAAQTLREVQQLTTRIEANSLPKGEALLSQTEQTLQDLKGLLQRAETLMEGFSQSETILGKVLNDPAFASQIDTTIRELTRTLQQINNEKIIVGFRRK